MQLPEKARRGSINNIFVGILVAAIVLAVCFVILENFMNTLTANSVAYNSTKTIEGYLGTFGPLIILVILASAIIGVVMTVMRRE